MVLTNLDVQCWLWKKTAAAPEELTLIPISSRYRHWQKRPCDDQSEDMSFNRNEHSDNRQQGLIISPFLGGVRSSMSCLADKEFQKMKVFSNVFDTSWVESSKLVRPCEAMVLPQQWDVQKKHIIQGEQVIVGHNWRFLLCSAPCSDKPAMWCPELCFWVWFHPTAVISSIRYMCFKFKRWDIAVRKNMF